MGGKAVCEANAYLVVHGGERLLMESVDTVRPEGGDMWLIENIFGNRLAVRGRIKEMSLVNHRVVFEEIPGAEHSHGGTGHSHGHGHVHSHGHAHGDAEEGHGHGHEDHDKEPHNHGR
jgi:predicted RNA-binding protein